MISKFETNHITQLSRHFDTLGALSDVIPDYDFRIFTKTLEWNDLGHHYMYWYHKDHLGSSTQIKGTATNAVNPGKLSIIDLVFGRPGQSMLHEATEAFEAAKISAKDQVKAGPAKSGIFNPVANSAHDAAVWQPEFDPIIFELVPKIQQSYKMMTR